MASGVLVGGLLLAGVFAAAGVAKLVDLEGSRSALTAFGVPRSLVAPLGTLLPIAELATAGLLVAGVGGDAGGVLVAGALSALFLLALFCAGIAISLVRGRAPDCHCFGQLHSAPASSRTLARNGALLTLAAFVASGGDPVWTAAAGAVALAVVGLVVGLNSRTRREDGGEVGTELGLAQGSPAPAFELPSLDGSIVSLAALRRGGRPVLLVFTDPQCGPCLELAPDVADWQRRHADQLTIAVIESRNGESVPVADEQGRENVLFQRESEVAEAYRARGTPTAVLVGPEGEVASPVAGGAIEIEALVAENVTGLQPRLAPGKLGRGFVRRELLVRGAGAWAGASAVLALPLRAVAGVTGRQPRAVERCEDNFDCPDPQHMRCREGRCRCDEGLTRCDPDEATTQRCFSLQTDELHCGGCNRPCAADDEVQCCDGECTLFGQNRCSCGGSDICDEDEVCRDGVCVQCPGGLRRCGNDCGDPQTQRCCGNTIYDNDQLGPGDWRCCGPQGNRVLVDARTNARHCGGCNRRCARDELCDGGRCRKRCSRGSRQCGRTCYRESREICCGGRVYSRETLLPGSQCCGDEIIQMEEGGWFCP